MVISLGWFSLALVALEIVALTLGVMLGWAFGRDRRSRP
jgi:hypothetical protein